MATTMMTTTTTTRMTTTRMTGRSAAASAAAGAAGRRRCPALKKRGCSSPSRGGTAVVPAPSIPRERMPPIRAASAPAPPSLPPPAVFKAACNMSAAKAAYSWDKTLVLGFLAGSLIGIGALLCSVVSGSSPALASSNPGLASFVKGAIGLPAGLSMVILTGGELFTGNVFVMGSGLLTGKVKAADVAKNWFWSFNGNFLGSIFVALMALVAGTTASEALTASVTKMAVAKVSMGFTTLFAKGVLCNWLVCLAVWMAMASNTIPGKLLSVFIPISTFVTLGFEHSVANMFLIAQGILAGAEITIKEFLLGNMVPVTLGNIVGSAVFVAFAHYWAYGRD